MRTTYEDKLKGCTVVDATGRVLGEVDKIIVDDESWRVESLCVKLRREAAEAIGVEHSMFHSASIEIPTSEVQGSGDTVLLRRDAADLVGRPGVEQPAPTAFGSRR